MNAFLPQVIQKERRKRAETLSVINRNCCRVRRQGNTLKYDNASKPQATTSHSSLQLMLVVAQQCSCVFVVQENKVGLSCLECLGTADNTFAITSSEKQRRGMNKKQRITETRLYTLVPEIKKIFFFQNNRLLQQEGAVTLNQ